MLSTVLAHGGPALHHLAWRFDPLLGAGLVATGWIYLRGARLRRGPAGRTWAFGLGWVVVALASMSPLDALGEVLISAHMVQHLVVTLVAAPLLVAGQPSRTLLAGLPSTFRRRAAAVLRPGHGGRIPWILSWTAYTGALWLWHAARLYEGALAREWIHGLQHLSFLAAGVAFWAGIFEGVRRGVHGEAILFVFTTALAGVVLSALITFSGSPWYQSYVGASPAWALPADEDQRLAGVIMWFASSAVYAATVVWLVAAWIRSTDRVEVEAT
jgi:putative membrane protein